ncbi:MAG: hypothetical protein ABH854_02975 [Candidatus Diapherotrites archaeon]
MAFKGMGKFQIAAMIVIILAVIALVLSTICFGCGGVTDPDNSVIVIGKLKNLANNIGISEKTQTIVWNNGDSLFSRNLANATSALGEDQVCVLGGDFVNNKKFTDLDMPGRMFTYKGTSKISTKLLVICEQSNRMEKTLEQYYFSWIWQFRNCECNIETPETCCIVAVVENI